MSGTTRSGFTKTKSNLLLLVALNAQKAQWCTLGLLLVISSLSVFLANRAGHHFNLAYVLQVILYHIKYPSIIINKNYWSASGLIKSICTFLSTRTILSIEIFFKKKLKYEKSKHISLLFFFFFGKLSSIYFILLTHIVNALFYVVQNLRRRVVFLNDFSSNFHYTQIKKVKTDAAILVGLFAPKRNWAPWLIHGKLTPFPC